MVASLSARPNVANSYLIKVIVCSLCTVTRQGQGSGRGHRARSTGATWVCIGHPRSGGFDAWPGMFVERRGEMCASTPTVNKQHAGSSDAVYPDAHEPVLNKGDTAWEVLHAARCLHLCAPV